MNILKFFEKNKTSKNKIKIFASELNKWNENNKKLFYDSHIYYENNCCANCGCVFDKKINSTIICPTCKKRNIIKTNPINKNKIIILEEEKQLFDKEKTKLKYIKVCEQYINYIFEFYPKYKKEFMKFKNTHINHSAIDITYQFQNRVAIRQELEARKLYNKLSKGLQKNVDSKLYPLVDYNVHQITDNLLTINTLEKNNIELLFLEKKYGIILSYLPINIYVNITRFIFCWNKLLHYDCKEKEIIQSILTFCNLALRLFEESNYTIKDLKESFDKQIISGIGYVSFDKNEAWKYTEKGIKMCIKHKENNLNSKDKKN